jgi:hypothetical protein
VGYMERGRRLETLWKSRHWKSDERPKLMVKPLIPFDGNSQIGQKYPQNGRLPCVIFLEVARWWTPS